LLKRELRLSHTFGREAARVNRVIEKADAHCRIRELASHSRLLTKRLGARQQGRVARLIVKREIFGFRERQRHALLCLCRHRTQQGQ